MFDVIAGLAEAFIVADDRGRIIGVNSACAAMLGYGSGGSLVGCALTEIMPARFHEAHRAGFARYLETGESRLAGRSVRVPAVRADGTEVAVDLTVHLWRAPDGKLVVFGALLEPDASRAVLVDLEAELAARRFERVERPLDDGAGSH